MPKISHLLPSLKYKKNDYREISKTYIITTVFSITLMDRMV